MRIKNPQTISSHGNVEGRKQLLQILEAGLQAADPYFNAKRLFRLDGHLLSIGYDDFVPAGSPRRGTDVYDLERDIDRIFVFGAGKGIQRVAEAVEEILGDYLTGGMILLKYNDENSLKKVQVSFGGHPIPDQACVDGCRRMVRMIGDLHLTERDLVITITGNGGSSLLTLPCGDLTLEDVKAVTSILQIKLGLLTPQVNIVRNQLDLLKGGRITRLLAPAKMVHLFPVDLDEPNAYGDVGYAGLMRSNFWLHTLPDMSTPELAVKLLKDNRAWDCMPEAVRRHLLYPDPGQDVMHADEFEKLDCRIFGLMPTKYNFIPVTMDTARRCGYEPHFLMRRTFVDASAAGQLIGRIAVNVANEGMPFRAPCALFLTGELTVAVDGQAGVGGRNQMFALNAAKIIRGSGRIVVGAVDTDGTDGPGGYFHEAADAAGCNNLAGGVVDGYTMDEAKERNVDVEEALRTCAASKALWELDSGVWATQNISEQDLIVVLIMDHDGAR